MKEIRFYKTANNKVPFEIWYRTKDKAVQSRILARLQNVQRGTYGAHRNLTSGVKELKFTSGDRVYFAELDNIIILLLCGGDKTRQSNDIEKAITYLQDYNKRANNNEQ